MGEATPDEKRDVRGWLNQSLENRKLYNELKEIWLTSGVQNNADEYNVEEAILAFRSQIGTQRKTRKITIPQIFRYAAVLLLLISIPLSYFIGKRSIPEDTYSTIYCAMGDKSLIYLPDSTEVWLNSGSTFRFNNNFKKGKREVFLDGEAYFSVTKDKDNPFQVNSGDINVEVLGTQFNMKAYPDESQISTTLIEGSVKVSSPGKIDIIKPGQKLVYDNDSQKVALYELADTSPETEWKDGRLVFRNESLAELKKKLERWFDVDIELADEIVSKRRYTGTIARESILEVMSYFSLAQSVEYKIEGNQVTFFNQPNK